jgi:hypothetical protein
MVSPIIEMTNTEKQSGISGIPTQLLVLHSGECPLRGGYAQSLTNWANIPLAQGGPEASWHWFVDPIAIVSMVPAWLAAWHASEANPMSEGFEQAGYARFSRAEWLTPEGVKQMDNLAWLMAQRAKANNIEPRWLSTAEVEAVTKHGNRTITGFCTHRQIDPETRTDPGNGYPYELLMAQVRNYMGGITPQGNTEEDMALAPDEREWLKYIASPEFKAHIFNGASAVEREARATFNRELLNTDVPWYGFNGQIPESGRRTTTPATDLGWADSRAAGQAAQVATLLELVKQLSVAQGVVIDYEAIAKAVNDDAASRLSS